MTRVLAMLVVVQCATLEARAQQPPPPPDSVIARLDTTQLADTSGVSPRSAMIRSWLVPGWGQASVGAYFRGGVFVAMQGASWYMLIKTIGRLQQAQAIERARVNWVSDSLRSIIFADPEGRGAELRDPVAFDEAVSANERVAAARNLADSRSQQRQDWIAATLFLTLISGVDAFVAAHLADAPVSLETTAAPDGSVHVGIRVPLGTRR